MEKEQEFDHFIISEGHRKISAIQIFAFCLKTIWKAGPFLLTIVIIVTFLQGFAPALTIWVHKLTINAVVNLINKSGNYKESVVYFRLLGLELLVLIGTDLLVRMNAYSTYLLGKLLEINMTGEILRKASLLDFAFYENSTFYDMMNKARNESKGKPLVLAMRVNDTIRGIIVFISMGGLVAMFSLQLFAAMIIVCLPLFFVGVTYGRKNYQLQQSVTEARRRSSYLSGIMTTREYRPDVLCNGLWYYLFKKWWITSKKILDKDKHLAGQQHLAETIAGLIMTISTIGATAYVVYVGVIKSNFLNVGEIIMYSSAFTGGVYGLRRGLDGLSGIYKDSLFLKNLLKFNEIKSVIESQRGKRAIPKVFQSIDLKNVSFKYPGAYRYALRKITVTFKRSEGTLIVGANGAGKSTLIKLLLRLYDPTEGQILLNGIDIREFELSAYRRAIGIIFQDFVCYAFSAGENIGCGNINDLRRKDKIIEAAKRVKANSLIEQLPQRYDTMLSKLFKNGHELSRGQWQRICLARLFMKDAPVVILDEPTASLDIDTEVHLLQEIDHLSKDKIRIFISHRVFQPSITDQIMVLSEGKVIEVGNYESLMAHNGEFSRLRRLYCDLQNTTQEKLSVV
jgi:ABC-type multidrug transport system fused ATPase/permease subunit